MTTSKPKVDPDGLYTPTQAAKALGVCRHTLLRYADAGLIKYKVRKVSGRRIYKGADIIKCWREVYL